MAQGTSFTSQPPQPGTQPLSPNAPAPANSTVAPNPNYPPSAPAAAQGQVGVDPRMQQLLQLMSWAAEIAARAKNDPTGIMQNVLGQGGGSLIAMIQKIAGDQMKQLLGQGGTDMMQNAYAENAKAGQMNPMLVAQANMPQILDWQNKQQNIIQQQLLKTGAKLAPEQIQKLAQGLTYGDRDQQQQWQDARPAKDRLFLPSTQGPYMDGSDTNPEERS